MDETLYDVVATNIETGAHRYLATGKTEKNAEAVVMIAVMRRGVEEEFYTSVPAGSYADKIKEA